MGIISIPLTGELRHQDSMGNSHDIKAGEELKRRGGLGIEDASSIEISTTENCQLLVIEVPMRSFKL